MPCFFNMRRMGSAPSALSAAVNTNVICFFEGSVRMIPSVLIDITIGLTISLLHTLFLEWWQIIGQAGSTIHGWFVGRIITDGIVINHLVGLKTLTSLLPVCREYHPCLHHVGSQKYFGIRGHRPIRLLCCPPLHSVKMSEAVSDSRPIGAILPTMLVPHGLQPKSQSRKAASISS